VTLSRGISRRVEVCRVAYGFSLTAIPRQRRGPPRGRRITCPTLGKPVLACAGAPWAPAVPGALSSVEAGWEFIPLTVLFRRLSRRAPPRGRRITCPTLGKPVLACAGAPWALGCAGCSIQRRGRVGRCCCRRRCCPLQCHGCEGGHPRNVGPPAALMAATVSSAADRERA